MLLTGEKDWKTFIWSASKTVGVAGQKYGLERDAARRFYLSEKATSATDNHLLP